MIKKPTIVAVALFTAGIISTIPAHAADPTPAPTASNEPCAKKVAAHWMGDQVVTVKDVSGVIRYVRAGYPQWFCPTQVYVHSGVDVTAHTGSSAYSGSNYKTWTATGWATFTTNQKSIYTATLWVSEA